MSRKHIYIKIGLVIVVEAIAMLVNHAVSTYIFHIPHSLTASVLIGSVLASVVVWRYNKRLLMRKQAVQKELNELRKVTLKYTPEENNNGK